MIYGFSPHTAEMVELLLERGLPCLRRGCDCSVPKGGKR